MSLEPAFAGIDPPRSGLRVDHLPAVAADSCAFQGADLLGSSWALTSRAHQNQNGAAAPAKSESVQLTLVASTATQVALLHGRRRAQLKSWAVRAGASTGLTHAAVAFPGTDVLVAVQAKTRLVAWSLEHDNISQGSKATVSDTFLDLSRVCPFFAGALRFFCFLIRISSPTNPAPEPTSSQASINMDCCGVASKQLLHRWIGSQWFTLTKYLARKLNSNIVLLCVTT
jgi:hypothetical protein